MCASFWGDPVRLALPIAGNFFLVVISVFLVHSPFFLLFFFFFIISVDFNCVGPRKRYVTLLIVTRDLSRFPGVCLWTINRYQNVRDCALVDAWLVF